MDQASLFDTEVASENENALSKGDSKRAEDAAALTENAGRAAKEAELLSKEDVATAKAPEHAQAAARAAELRHLLDYHAYRY